MRIVQILVVLILILGCSPARSERSANSQEDVVLTNLTKVETSVDVDLSEDDHAMTTNFGQLQIARANDSDVVAKRYVEYFPETDRVKNMTEIEPSEDVLALLSKPISNLPSVSFDSTASSSTFADANAALRQFKIELSERELAELKTSNSEAVRVTRSNITIYLYRSSESSYAVWIVEVSGSGNEYVSTLQIGTDLVEVTKRLGEPNFQKSDGSILIYKFFRQLRQINMKIKDGKVEVVQYILWTDV